MKRIRYDFSDLNQPISEVFTNHPEKWEELINLKALLGAYLANLERVFRGAFGQELELEGTQEQYDLFKKIFPVVGAAMDKSFGQAGLNGFCRKLSAIRNTCMHGFSKVSQMTETVDYTFMRALPNWAHYQYQYVTNGNRLTLAGLLAILLCMGNKEMVTHLMTSGIAPLVERIGLWRGFQECRGKAFAEALEIHLGNDFEQEIRTNPGYDIFSAIWGEYAFRVEGDQSSFMYLSEKGNKHSVYRVTGSLTEDGGRLFIKKGSIYHVYFPEDYELEILDKEYFIECSNKVPPFLFVAYLYRKGVHAFDRNSLSEDDIKLFPKLNKAKFFVDKNIHVILLGKAVSDQRTVHQAATPQALYAILNLEWNLRKAHKKEIERFSFYSTIKESLQIAKVKHSLIEDALSLRNFFAHGSIFGDYVGKMDNTYRKFELADCIDVFKNLVLALRENDRGIADAFQRDVSERFAEQLVDMKYKALTKIWYQAYNGTNIDWETYGRTMMRISHSYITSDIEERLSWFKTDSDTARFDVVEIEAPEGLTFMPNGQYTPKGRLTIAMFEMPVELETAFGDQLDAYRIVEESKNSLVAYRKLRC